MNFLVTGGAGYIGSHLVKKLIKNRDTVDIVDNFSTGHKWAVKDCNIYEVDMMNSYELNKLLKSKKYDGIFHFAAKSIVAESNKLPIYYYQNNITGFLNLIDLMIKNGNKNIIFSSTAAVYGLPESNKIDENHPKKPINTYGMTKLVIENMLKDFYYKNGINSVIFRYFNAAGADDIGDIGELHEPETHLIPNIINAAINNRTVKVFGKNYNTFDGTCIRDYIHVNDIADSHILGLKKIFKNGGHYAYNLGNGEGFSVLEIINSCEKILGKKIKFEIHEPREGDPDKLIADSQKAKTELNWKPKYQTIDSILKTAINWHLKNKK